MTVQNGLVRSYATNIYIDGTRTFATILSNYVAPVKQYAATGVTNNIHYPAGFSGYTMLQIEAAFSEGRITEQEYNDTLAYI